jgi:predicted GH43/DUF377 family glycosyl hydrolase
MLIKHLRLVFSAVLLLFSMVSLVYAQDNSGSTPLFTPYEGSPVIEHGETGTWNASFNEPGAVIFHDGQFHMFRTGYSYWPNASSIDYLTSPDGLTWTGSNEPVFTTDEVSYAGLSIGASSVLVEEDGTWVLYFYIYDTGSWPLTLGAIGRATADDPLGPWTPMDAPVLLPGAEGEWDGLQVSHPNVLRTDDGYVMYYSGYSTMRSRPTRTIGMATSDDGIVWTKYDDPTTTEAPFAESDSILIADQDWEGREVFMPRVQSSGDGWVMIYKATQQGLGLALSEDGIQWSKVENNPVVAATDLGSNLIGFTTLLRTENDYYLYMEGSTIQGKTDIYVAIHEGNLELSE